MMTDCKKYFVFVFENVPGILSAAPDGTPITNLIRQGFRDIGYDIIDDLRVAKVNASDFGVPQNRERVFMVSILDKDAEFSFPEPQELKRTVKDVLESEVDESYFLSEDKVRKLLIDAAPEQLMKVGMTTCAE